VVAPSTRIVGLNGRSATCTWPPNTWCSHPPHTRLSDAPCSGWSRAYQSSNPCDSPQFCGGSRRRQPRFKGCRPANGVMMSATCPTTITGTRARDGGQVGTCRPDRERAGVLQACDDSAQEVACAELRQLALSVRSAERLRSRHWLAVPPDRARCGDECVLHSVRSGAVHPGSLLPSGARLYPREGRPTLRGRLTDSTARRARAGAPADPAPRGSQAPGQLTERSPSTPNNA
jgi:hypothetical protein